MNGVPGRTMTAVPSVNSSNRARMNASPGPVPVMTPSSETVAAASLLPTNTAKRVTSRSVPSRVLRPDDDALGLALRREHGLLREHLDADRLRRVLRVARGAGLEPADEEQVVLAARFDPLAAGVRHLAGRLVHDEAVVGRGEVDAPAAHLARDAEVVALGVVAEQRQAEAVLARGRAVALAGVAADLA